MISTKYFPLP